MDPAACIYGPISTVAGAPPLPEVRVRADAPCLIRPLLIATEHRVVFGRDEFWPVPCWDSRASLGTFSRRFRRGSWFSFSVSFLLFLRTEHETWTYLPANPFLGLSIRPETKDRAAVQECLAGRLTAQEAIDEIAKLRPRTIERDGDMVRPRGERLSAGLTFQPEPLPGHMLYMIQQEADGKKCVYSWGSFYASPLGNLKKLDGQV